MGKAAILVLLNLALVLLVLQPVQSFPSNTKMQISGRGIMSPPLSSAGRTKDHTNSSFNGKNESLEQDFTDGKSKMSNSTVFELHLRHISINECGGGQPQNCELERLCPYGELEVLKSISTALKCHSGGLEFWYRRCRCHYAKNHPCPDCTDTGPATGSGHGVPHFVLGSPNGNSTVIYQIPFLKPGNNSETDLATANKFNVYNTAGGVINLYFYQAGQQQLVSSAAVAGNKASKAGHGSASSSLESEFLSVE